MEPIKILWLGNSNDTRSSIAQGARRPEIMAAMLEAEFGRPVTVVPKRIWPTPRLTALIERWMEDERPDIAWFNVSGYWFTYESTPLRVGRLFGRFGKKAAGLGESAGADPRFADRALFRQARRLLQLAVGGDTAISSEETIRLTKDCARLIRRSESTTLVIDGPRGQSNYFPSRRAERRAERRRLSVHQGLVAAAAEMRVVYFGSDSAQRRELGEPTVQPDRFHADEEAHFERAKREFPVLLEAARRAGLDSLSASDRAKL